MNLYADLIAKVKASGFAMNAVCLRAGVSTGAPAHWVDGNVKPNQRTYDRLLDALKKMVNERDENLKSAGLK